MKVRTFAALKEYFQPEFELEEEVRNTEELRARLLVLNGKAADILRTCRYAVGSNFIDNDYNLQANDTVIIIPPSSGG